MLDAIAKILSAAALAVTAQVIPGIHLVPVAVEAITSAVATDDPIYNCLHEAQTTMTENRRAAEDEFRQEIALARRNYQDAVKRAWDTRETTIKDGRVIITAPDRHGQDRPDIKAERDVFETAKKDAEDAYEAAKKSASLDWQEAQKKAREKLRSAQQDEQQRLQDAKADCVSKR